MLRYDVDYNIHFVVSSKHPPAPSEPQINVVPLTYVGKINIGVFRGELGHGPL